MNSTKASTSTTRVEGRRGKRAESAKRPSGKSVERVDEKERSGARSIIRACTLLKLVGQSGEKGASLNELIAMAKVPKSSAHRYLQVLEKEGLIERLDDG